MENKVHYTTYGRVNRDELPRPSVVVEERTVIETVIVGRVSFSVVGWSQHRHFVPVHAVVSEKEFHLLGNLRKTT